MMKHLLSATALVAVAFMACPASAQQPRSGTTGYAMVDDYSRSDSYSDDYYDRGDYRYDDDRYVDRNEQYRDTRYPNDNRRYRHDRDAMLRCESIENARSFCHTGGARSVALVTRLSDASCVKNRTWGYNGRRIWVDRGCRADFRVRG